MVDLEFLRFRYGNSSRDVFEELATRLFMKMLCLSESPIRRPDEEGIESEPVRISSDLSGEYKAGTYAYQAKYYNNGTIISRRKSDFLKSIKAAKKNGADHLVFYINIDFFHKSNRGSKKSDCEIEIEKFAESNHIILHWFPKDRIRTMLDKDPDQGEPDYRPIRNIFFSQESAPDIYGFYEYICNELSVDSGNEMYGRISLLDNYIAPYLIDSDNTRQSISVRDYLESWISENQSFITVICGEPGHGKTSLCRKAMYDFYKNGWLVDKVDQVFCFSLNPAGTMAVTNEGVRFDLLLSWGDGQNRSVKKNQIVREVCKNALVFFDGFDEFLEWMPEYRLYDFISDFILDFQKFTNAHIVITSRKMVIDPECRVFSYKNVSNGTIILVPIKELSLITKEQQYKWIQRYIHQMNEIESINKSDIAKMKTYFNSYQSLCEKLKAEDDLNEILGIPIIFRMIVGSRYIPTNNSRLAEIYVNLFHATWERHQHKKMVKGRPNLYNKEMITNMRLAQHALKIFADNNETAVSEEGLNTEETTWVYSFYTKNRGNQRVGFWHRTFYEYFLAFEILSWFASFSKDGTWESKDKNEFINRLSGLSRRRLNSETLFFIRDLYHMNRLDENSEIVSTLRKEGLSKVYDVAFTMAYQILKETDGIIELSLLRNNVLSHLDKTGNRRDFNDVAVSTQYEKSVSPFIRGNNVFWNVVSICGICDHPLQKHSVNEEALRYYDMSGCWMNRAELSGCYLRAAHFEYAHLENAIIKGSDLKMINLTGAHLKGARLNRSNISFATLIRAELEKSYFVGADLTEADLRRADLTDSNLELTDLTHTDLRDTTLIRTKFLDLWSKYHLEMFEQPRGEFNRLVYRSDIGRGNSGYIRKRVHIEKTLFSGAKLTKEDAETLGELGIDIEKEKIELVPQLTQLPLSMSRHVRCVEK